ncbi:hypothetical protein BCR44DRAFT_1220676 [Catenaria anguillulae PL171]|uniref:Uncharacterized protein n=1 Tax=Catenaria anguillulae PL171 TaxID=765915 RepID=A0A1Y2I267_9FUNG|nr:hypothetical protein BCR44DRAFT_1220676 [Catenaria anguillulae PL171]
MQKETLFNPNAPSLMSESYPLAPSSPLTQPTAHVTKSRSSDACRSMLEPSSPAESKANAPSNAPCPNCSSLVELLKKVKVDYDFNVSLIAERDAELKRWEDRDAWWRKRWKDSSLEKDQLTAQLRQLRDQLSAATAPRFDNDGQATCAPDGGDAPHAEAENSRVGDLATIESLRATVRDLQVRLRWCFCSFFH